jgi:terminase large subunit-like protein
VSTPNFKRAVLNKAALFEKAGYVPHAGQQAIHDAGPHDLPGGYRFRIASCGVRFGKTHASAWELSAAALAPNDHEFEGWCVAPLHSLADRCFRMVCSIFQEHFPEHVVSVKEGDGELVIYNLAGKKARILRKSTERGKVALTGASVDAMVIDEASAVPDDIWESSLSTRLLDRLGWVLAISTPRGTVGWWTNHLRAGLRGDDPDVWAIKLPTWVNPRVSKAELRKIRDRLPEHIFQQEYAGELVASAGAVFDHDAIEMCSIVTRWENPVAGEIYVAGLDIAMSHDYTVLTVARQLDDGRAHIAYAKAWRKLPWEEQIRQVRKIVAYYNHAQLRVDESGLGKPVVQSMKSDGDFEGGVRGEVFTPSSKNAMVRNLAVLLERGRIALPVRELCPDMTDQLEKFAYLDGSDAPGVNGLRRMGAPRGEHDDYVASLLLLGMFFRGGGYGSGSRVARRESNGYSERRDSGQHYDSGQIRLGLRR